MPTHHNIAYRAYDLWERHGRRHGHDLDDWFQAEGELAASEHMNTKQTTESEAAQPKGHLVLFLPYLRLKTGHSIAGVDFVPLRDGDEKMPAELTDAEKPLLTILSSHIDRHGEPFDNCVVATIPGRGWDLTRADRSTVKWAAELLFLAAWATSHYFPRFGGPYTNSSAFRVVGQAYVGDEPGFIALVARRRDGSSWDGGYKHGEFTFSIPLQVSIRDVTDVDEPFLVALGKAVAAKSPTIERLRTALPFVQLANTDDDVMTEHAEAILMGSAFEQLFGTEYKYELAKAFGELLSKFGNVTVADAQKRRPHITIDKSDPARAAAQPKWWVHRKWMEELYDVRNSVVHEGQHAAYSWGWALHEHLVMAAFVFPVAVKLLLAKEGHYTPTSEDDAQCKAIDQLLGITGWDEDSETDNDGRAWHKIVSSAKWDQDLEKRMAEFLKEHPDFSW
jgi:Protein of unknown function (DUF2934)